MTVPAAGRGILSDAHRRQLLERVRPVAQDAMSAGIPRRGAGLVEVPLSFGQEQLWFLDRLAPGLPTYNIAEAVRMVGRLEVGALAGALAGLRARHEVLRTRLVEVHGTPVQVIDPPAPVEVPVVDLRQVPEVQREARWRALAGQQAVGVFRLEEGALWRDILHHRAHGRGDCIAHG